MFRQAYSSDFKIHHFCLRVRVGEHVCQGDHHFLGPGLSKLGQDNPALFHILNSEVKAYEANSV